MTAERNYMNVEMAPGVKHQITLVADTLGISRAELCRRLVSEGLQQWFATHPDLELKGKFNIWLSPEEEKQLEEQGYTFRRLYCPQEETHKRQ